MKPKLSQVFLHDKNIKLRIIDALKKRNIQELSNNLLEVAVGSGEITKHLIQEFKDMNYVGVEFDRSLSLATSHELNIHIINIDFLKLTTQDVKIHDCVLFCAIPYHITTKFIDKFINLLNLIDIKMIAFIIQKEAFERILVDTIPTFWTFRQMFKLEQSFNVKRQCFSPKPNVDSMFSIWTRLDSDFTRDPKSTLETVKILNFKRNKNIQNNIKHTNPNLLPFIENKNVLGKKFSQLTNQEILEIINVYKHSSSI